MTPGSIAIACMALGVACAGGGVAFAGEPSASAPAATPTPLGPCEHPGLASVAVRPGIGRSPATGGAVCVAPSGAVILSIGYRDQVTSGVGSQRLVVYPAPVVLIGLRNKNEIIVEPGLGYSQRAGSLAGGLPPLSGRQDTGIGFQHVLSDRAAMQQAVEVFVTFPSGYPAGSTGFSAGVPTYQASYTAAFVVTPRIGISVGQSLSLSYAATPANIVRRFIGYQIAGAFSYALTRSTSLLLEDQISAPGAPSGPTGNRALVGVQKALSPNLVLDLDYELNALPPPGVHQHTTFEAGATIQL